MVKQNLELTKAECRANAVKRMRESLSGWVPMGATTFDPKLLSDVEIWLLFREMESARDESAAEGGYFQGEI